MSTHKNPTRALAIAVMNAKGSKELIAAVLRRDFESPYDTPKVELVRRLLSEGLTARETGGVR